MRITCSECAKYKGGWCRYKGVDDPDAVKADRRSRLCKPVSLAPPIRTDYGEIDAGAMRRVSFNKQFHRGRR